VAAAALTCVVAVSPGTTARQEPPLPDRQAFLEEAARRLKGEDVLRARYIYRERQVRVDFDEDGRPEKKTTRDFEVYPSVQGSPSYRRLLATNGVPELPSRLAEADRKHREHLQEWLRERQSESPSARARRQLAEKQERDQEARIVDDIPRVYDIQFVGRQAIRGRPAIVMTLIPRPGVRPVVEDAAPMAKARGRAWVDEADRELVRVEFESTETISIGLGVVARVHKGTTVAFERQKVDGETWLPARVEIRPRARVALLRRVDADIVSEFSDYRKYTVEAAMDVASSGPGR